MSEDLLKDFSIVEMKLAIKRIIRCYTNDLNRKPTLGEIHFIYSTTIREFLEEKSEWFQREKDDSEHLMIC